MTSDQPNLDDALILGLSALAWTLADDRRAERLLALTGLAPADLRDGAGDPTTLAALLSFLEAHEPDLLACGAALGHAPERLVRARMLLEGARA